MIPPAHGKPAACRRPVPPSAHDSPATGWASGFDELANIGEATGVLRIEVAALAQDARKSRGNAGLVAPGGRQPLESQLEHQLRLQRPHRAEALARVLADPVIQLGDLPHPSGRNRPW